MSKLRGQTKLAVILDDFQAGLEPKTKEQIKEDRKRRLNIIEMSMKSIEIISQDERDEIDKDIVEKMTEDNNKIRWRFAI